MKRAKPKSLFTETIELLHASRGKFREISEETGLDYDWLHALSQGKIGDPGVKKIERLHQHLSG